MATVEAARAAVSSKTLAARSSSSTGTGRPEPWIGRCTVSPEVPSGSVHPAVVLAYFGSKRTPGNSADSAVRTSRCTAV